MRLRLFIITHITYTLSLIDHLTTSPARCNPALDLMFTLGSVSYLDFAERIISDLARHPLPEYTVRAGVTVCDNTTVSVTPLMSGLGRLLTALRTRGQQVRTREYMTHSDKNHCMNPAKDTFNAANARIGASKMLIFVTDGAGWDSDSFVGAATDLKIENVTVLTVGIGIKQIHISADLEKMASDKNLSFIVRDVKFLPSLSSIFSIGTCQPLSVDLSAMIDISPTEVPVSVSTNQPPVGCQKTRLNGTHYKEEQVIPGFGTLNQVLACPLGQQYDVTVCDCS